MAEVHYVETGYVEPEYYQTGITIDWVTRIITVPRIAMTLVSPGVYTLDLTAFHSALRVLEDTQEGMTYPKTHNHNTEVVLSGVTYARVIEIINGYTVTFENLLYKVNASGANSNLADVTNLNLVSLATANSGGLIVVGAGAAPTAQQNADAVWANISRTLTDAVGLTIAENAQLMGLPSAAAISTAVWGDTVRTLTEQTGLTLAESQQLAYLLERLDGDPLKPNTYSDDKTSITNGTWTLTNVDNLNGTHTVTRS